MSNLVHIIQTALALVQKDASKQLLPLFKAMVLAILGSPTDPVNAVLQFNVFLTSAAALLPVLTKELQTDIGNAIITWADASAGTTAPPVA